MQKTKRDLTLKEEPKNEGPVLAIVENVTYSLGCRPSAPPSR